MMKEKESEVNWGKDGRGGEQIANAKAENRKTANAKALG